MPSASAPSRTASPRLRLYSTLQHSHKVKVVIFVLSLSLWTMMRCQNV
uniref:Uncharacterized protein n=1 Tax=Arundo donax TaxID=35708 RepID=A0A0A9EJW9_ARUDO